MASKTTVPKNARKPNKLIPNTTGTLPEEKLKFKRSHSCQDGSKFFPVHKWIFIFYCIFDVILLVFGSLLLLCGMYANTGYFSTMAITNKLWPNIALLNESRTFSRLEFLALACWISGKDGVIRLSGGWNGEGRG